MPTLHLHLPGTGRGCRTRLFLLAAGLALIMGCIFPFSPPPAVPLAEIRTLAVLPFAGDMGPAVRRHLWQAMDHQGRFRLSEPTPGAVSSKGDGAAPDDPAFWKQVKRLTAEAVLVARISARVTEREEIRPVQKEVGTGLFKTETRLLTGEEKRVEIMRQVVVPTPHGVREASLAGDFRIYHIRSRQPIFAQRITVGGVQAWRRDAKNPPADPPPPADGLLDRLAAELAVKAAAVIGKETDEGVGP